MAANTNETQAKQRLRIGQYLEEMWMDQFAAIVPHTHSWLIQTLLDMFKTLNIHTWQQTINTCHPLCIVTRYHSFLLAGGISCWYGCHFMASYSNAIFLSMKHFVLKDKKQHAVSRLQTSPSRPQQTHHCSLQHPLGKLKVLWSLHFVLCSQGSHLL